MVTARVGSDPAPTVTGSDADLDSLLQKTAEAIYHATQPYRFAQYLWGAGRVKEARTWLDPKNELPARDYLRLKIEQAMVVGDYDKALENLEALVDVAREGRGAGLDGSKSRSPGEYLGVAFGRSLLDFAPASGAVLTYPRLSALQSLQVFTERMIDEAEAHTVAGLLALEAGDPRAREEIALARSLWLNLRPVLAGPVAPVPLLQEWLNKLPQQ